MKLLLVNYEYPPLGGGSATATREIARALVRLGQGAVVLTAGPAGVAGSPAGESVEEGIVVRRLAVPPRQAHAARLGDMAAFLRAAMSDAVPAARRHGIDAALVFYSLPCGPVGLRLRAALGLPYVVTLRGADVPGLDRRVRLQHILLAPVRRRVLRSAAAVTATSDGLAAACEAADGIRPVVVRNGVDLRVYSPGPVAPGTRTGTHLVFCGRFQAEKDAGFLIRATAALRAAGVAARLSLVGAGPEEPALRAVAAAEGCDVTWHGWLPREAVADVLRTADCYVSAARYEGLPNAALEAMACGVPVLLTRIPGHEDLLRNAGAAHCGEMYDVASIPSFVAAWRRLAGGTGGLAAAGAAARAGLGPDRTWDATAARFLALFEPRTGRTVGDLRTSILPVAPPARILRVP